MSEHRILDQEKGGNGLEKALWPALKEKFPKYEVFWSKFVVPLTNRIYWASSVHKNIDLRLEVRQRNPDLIWLAQAHYHAFRAYGSAYCRIFCWDVQQLQNPLRAILDEDRFLDIYTRFISVADHVSSLASAIGRLKAAITGQAIAQRKLPAELHKDLDDYLAKQYENDYKEFERNGRPVYFKIHERTEALRQFDRDLYGEFKKFRDRLAQYRNLLHRAQPPQMWKNGEHYIAKPEKLSHYELWPDMSVASEEEIRSFFQNPQATMQRDFEEFSSFLDRIWDVFIREMDVLSQLSTYLEWIAKLPKDKLTSPMMSGPYSGVTTSTI